MERAELKAVIEGLLFVSGDEGMTAKQLAELLDVGKKKVVELVEEMRREFKQAHRGVQIIEVAGSYQMTTLQEHAPFYEKLAFAPTQATLSQAALETLAIIAYRQPMTKLEIEEIRGVKSDKAITTLMKKALIKEVGRMEGVGRPILYGTTKEFLDYFGLNRLEDLPSLSENPDLEEIEQEADLFFSK